MTHFQAWIQEMLAHLERARGGHARKSWSINFFVQIFFERELEKGMCEKVDQLTQLCYRSLAATWAHSMMGGEIECPSTMIQNDHCWPWSKFFINLSLSLLWIIVFLIYKQPRCPLLVISDLAHFGCFSNDERLPNNLYVFGMSFLSQGNILLEHRMQHKEGGVKRGNIAKPR